MTEEYTNHEYWISPTNGEIVGMFIKRPEVHVEGLNEKGYYVKFTNSDLTNGDSNYFRTHYFDEDYTEILERPDKPMEEATWNRASLKWEVSLDIYLAYLRNTRNIKLAECDFVMLSDIGLSELSKTTWEGYRQQLRDITTLVQNAQTQADEEGTGNPYLTFQAEITWPEVPTLHQPEDTSDLGGD